MKMIERQMFQKKIEESVTSSTDTFSTCEPVLHLGEGGLCKMF